MLRNSAVSTSGDTHQRVEIDGVRYSHIVDPRTGVGITDHSLVSLLAPDCTTTDLLETTVQALNAAPSAMGKDAAAPLRQPDMTVWFDLPAEIAAERLAGARLPDKFESQPLPFFKKVAEGYARRAAEAPQRFVCINANQSRHQVWQQVTLAMVRRGWLAIMVAADAGPH